MFQSINPPYSSTFPFDLSGIREDVKAALQSENGYLLPLRLFLGLVWAMAGVDKLSDPTWHSGDALSLFLNNQLATDAIYIPFYQTLITELFLPNAAILAWLVIMGEWLIGLAIMTGLLTNLALLCGIFMNINFMLAGAISPSSFFVVAQGLLFYNNVGAKLGIDSFLSTHISSRFLVAQPTTGKNGKVDSDEEIFMGGSLNEGRLRDKVEPNWLEKWGFLVVAFLSVLATFAAMPLVRSYTIETIPAPVMLIFILSGLICMLSLIPLVRPEQPV